MAFSHGSTAVFKVQDSGGTLRDLSAYLTSTGLPRETDVAETTTLGKTAKTYIPGLEDGSIPIEGPWEPTLDGYLDGIRRMTRNFEYYPAGTAVGAVKYSGACILTSYEINSEVEDANSFSGEFQITDTVTRAIVS
jgi:hypothetical protein